MNFVVTLYAALLFFILTPNVLLRIPRKGSVMVVAAVHALVFAVIYLFTHKIVWRLSKGMMPFKKEGFKEGADTCNKNTDCAGGEICDETTNICKNAPSGP